MPPVSPAQAHLMAAAAHNRGGYGGVPQSVGREFMSAPGSAPAPGMHGGHPMAPAANPVLRLQAAHVAALRGGGPRQPMPAGPPGTGPSGGY